MGVFYPSAEMLSMYSAAPADDIAKHNIPVSTAIYQIIG